MLHDRFPPGRRVYFAEQAVCHDDRNGKHDYKNASKHLECQVIKEMTGYGQSRHEYKKRDTGPQHITPSWLFEIDLVIILPCYFSQPEQIVEEIISPSAFLLFIFLLSHFLLYKFYRVSCDNHIHSIERTIRLQHYPQ
jgi:hypothetical protein